MTTEATASVTASKVSDVLERWVASDRNAALEFPTFVDT